VIPEETLRGLAEAYLSGDDVNGRSLKAFLKSLTTVTPTGYQVPLDALSRGRAMCAYYQGGWVRCLCMCVWERGA
jgi:hypothetical protein